MLVDFGRVVVGLLLDHALYLRRVVNHPQDVVQFQQVVVHDFFKLTFLTSHLEPWVQHDAMNIDPLFQLAAEHGINLGGDQTPPELYQTTSNHCCACSAPLRYHTCAECGAHNNYQDPYVEVEEPSRIHVSGPRASAFRGVFNACNIPRDAGKGHLESLEELNQRLRLLSKKTMKNASDVMTTLPTTRGKRRRQRLADVCMAEAVREGCALQPAKVKDQFSLTTRVRQRKAHQPPPTGKKRPTMRESIPSFVRRELVALGYTGTDIHTESLLWKAQSLAERLIFDVRYSGSTFDSTIKACVLEVMKDESRTRKELCSAMSVSVGTINPIVKAIRSMCGN